MHELFQDRRRVLKNRDHEAAEDASGQTADDAADRYRQSVIHRLKHGRRCAEVSIVADKPQRDKPGGNDRENNETRGVDFERTAHLLDAENDSGERCIECRGNAGGGTGKNEARLRFGEKRPAVNMTEAPICTVGPSRPVEAPNRSPSKVSTIFPIAMRFETRRSRSARLLSRLAAMHCGMPLPWALGKYRWVK
jgi:hypothetical protein